MKAATQERVRCTDCGATADRRNPKLMHDQTCPVWVTVTRSADDDRAWFARNPTRKFRRRPANWAEASQARYADPYERTVVDLIIDMDGDRLRYIYIGEDGRIVGMEVVV